MLEAAPLSLFELNSKIKILVKEGLRVYWLKAEISELKINYSGHCYLEFVQKDEQSERIIARTRAVIWANSFRMIKPYFETTTGRAFSEGIKVMVKASVEYHEVYGLSLIITDIEPTYTVGETALRKQKVLEKLKSEGIIDMNKDIHLAYLPQRLAVISSKTAAGFEDFVDQLEKNSKGFKFYYKLFPAVMQGNEAESSIINQLDTIYKQAEKFDAVIIIRGGGSQVDLECFNSYWLAYNITQFPLPVLTGIGHEQDDSVVDMVAHTRLKTPTAVAEFLISCMADVESDLLNIERQITDFGIELVNTANSDLREYCYKLQHLLHKHIQKENKQLSLLNSSFTTASKNNIVLNRMRLERKIFSVHQQNKLLFYEKTNTLKVLNYRMNNGLKTTFERLHHILEQNTQNAELNNPEHILKKGYSLTYFDGKIVRDGNVLKKGDEIITCYQKGKSTSIIK